MEESEKHVNAPSGITLDDYSKPFMAIVSAEDIVRKLLNRTFAKVALKEIDSKLKPFTAKNTIALMHDFSQMFEFKSDPGEKEGLPKECKPLAEYVNLINQLIETARTGCMCYRKAGCT